MEIERYTAGALFGVSYGEVGDIAKFCVEVHEKLLIAKLIISLILLLICSKQ